jgi:hypothetical protein
MGAPPIELPLLSFQPIELTGKVTELSTELASTKTTAQETAANAKVDVLIRQGKIAADKDTRATFVELAMNAPEQFEKVTAKLKPIVMLNTQHGSDDGGTGNEGSAIDEMNKAVRDQVTAAGGPTKLSTKEAIRSVSLSNPDLASRYRQEMNQNAGATGPAIH